MLAMQMERIVSLEDEDEPLTAVERPIPRPGTGQLRVHVLACGVCHTELDEIEGRLPPPRLPIVPGHQVVGRIDAVGHGVDASLIGRRVGVGWIHSSSGGLDENLSSEFVATGLDVDGGYAEFMTAPADYACPIPDAIDDRQAAPLLCAGAIGYRALKLSGVRDGQRLGLTGFGASAHLVLQLARHRFPGIAIYVFARDLASREFADSMGVDWVGATTDRAPHALDAIIDTTPAWAPVVEALANLRPGGRLVINAIRKDDRDKAELSRLSYHEHLWMEREIKSVANLTRQDIVDVLAIAATAPIRSDVTRYDLNQANRALTDLKRKPVRGVKVLTP